MKLTFTDDLSKNPFDLLNTCLNIQLYSKKITIVSIERLYSELKEHISADSYEIKMGLGNAYYNSSLYLKAQE